jgi:hypothetical protein
MHPLLNKLEGGDHRSIGRSDEVARMVQAQPELFEVLICGIGLDDPLLRMRCADAAEKVSLQHPDWLQPYKRLLIDYSRIEQKEVRWHIASMLARLSLTARQQRHVIEILLSWTQDRSSIVKTFSMQALADIASRDEALLPAVRQHIQELCVIGTPAMKARGRKLLSVFDSQNKKAKPDEQFSE